MGSFGSLGQRLSFMSFSTSYSDTGLWGIYLVSENVMNLDDHLPYMGSMRCVGGWGPRGVSCPWVGGVHGGVHVHV